MGRAGQDSDCEGAKAPRQVNLTSLAEGEGHYDCPIAEPAIATRFDLELHIRIIQSESSDRGPLIRRYGATDWWFGRESTECQAADAREDSCRRADIAA